MDDLGAATEDQVILAWLQAEIESTDFQAFIIGNPPNPANLSAALKAARSPNLRDDQQNALRREIISSVYGFGKGAGTFEGLGNDIRWRRFRLTPAEVGEMLYARHEGAWRLLSPVTRKVVEGASNVGHVFTGDQTNMVVLSLASGLCHSDKKVPEIIALRRPDGPLVILEGHARATALVLEAHRVPDGVHAYVGDGPSVVNWPYL
jgi:hypothetical protein